MDESGRGAELALGGDSVIVIVGAGLAGVSAALAAREEGFAGRIVLLSSEAHPPYDRPPLSKAVLMQEGEEHRIALAKPGEFEEAHIELRLESRCVEIDPDRRAVILESGDVLQYDRLVLATGSTVRTLPELPAGDGITYYLRNLEDALALRAAMARVRHIAIVGAGVIGLEVAAAMAGENRSVIVIDPADRVMSRAACHALSSYLHDRHRAQGVDIRLRTTISSVDRSDPRRLRLGLSDGTEFVADLVVVGIGVVPNVDLAAGSGLTVSPGGVRVDATGRTSDPAIYAAGEVAFHFNDRMGRHDRQETWAHAAAHGAHVGRAIVAGSDRGYDEWPSYWTDQYDFGVQVVGTPIGDIDVVRHLASPESFLLFHLIDGQVAGVSAVDAVRELRTARKLLGAAVADPAALGDPDRDLKAIASDIQGRLR